MPTPILPDRLEAVKDGTPHERLAAILDHYLDDPTRPEEARGRLLTVLERHPGLSREEQLIRFCDEIHSVTPEPILEVIHESEEGVQLKYLSYVLQVWREIQDGGRREDSSSEFREEHLVGHLVSELGFPRPKEPLGGLPSLLRQLQERRVLLAQADQPKGIVRHSAKILRIGRYVLHFLLCFYGQVAFQDEYAKKLAELRGSRPRDPYRFLQKLRLDELQLLIQQFEEHIESQTELKFVFQKHFGRTHLLPPEHYSAIQEVCRRKQLCAILQDPLRNPTQEHFEELRISFDEISLTLQGLQSLYNRYFPQVIVVRAVVTNELGETHIYFVHDDPNSTGSVELLAAEVPAELNAGARMLYYPWVSTPDGMRRRLPTDDEPLLFHPDPCLFAYEDDVSREELECEFDRDTQLLQKRLTAFLRSLPASERELDPPYDELFEILDGQVRDDPSLRHLLDSESARRRETWSMEFKASAYRYQGMHRDDFHPEPIARTVAAFANSAAIGDTRGGVLIIGIPDDPDNERDQRIAREMREELAKPAREHDIADRIMKTISGREGQFRCLPPVVQCTSHWIEAERLGYEGGYVLLIIVAHRFIHRGPVSVGGKVYRREYGKSVVAEPEWVSSWNANQEKFWSRQKGGHL